jgi:hypothetical protein
MNAPTMFQLGQGLFPLKFEDLRRQGTRIAGPENIIELGPIRPLVSGEKHTCLQEKLSHFAKSIRMPAACGHTHT